MEGICLIVLVPRHNLTEPLHVALASVHPQVPVRPGRPVPL